MGIAVMGVRVGPKGVMGQDPPYGGCHTCLDLNGVLVAVNWLFANRSTNQRLWSSFAFRSSDSVVFAVTVPMTDAK